MEPTQLFITLVTSNFALTTMHSVWNARLNTPKYSTFHIVAYECREEDIFASTFYEL